MNRKEIYDLIEAERARQDAKWGEQNIPLIRDEEMWRFYYLDCAEGMKNKCARNFAAGTNTWDFILREEVYEALSETDEDKVEEELVQVAAVAVAMIECMRRKKRCA